MNKNLIAALLLVAGCGTVPVAMAGDEESCLECHEPAEDWEDLSAEEIMTEARSPDNKRHRDNADLSDDALQAIISTLMGEDTKPCDK